jgi:hypothetical protein
MMRQIGYFSTASGTQDARTVHNILVAARQDNLRDGITGLLVAGGGRYLQVIEGPHVRVEALYERIRADSRHFAVATFLDRDVEARNFGSWSMAFCRPAADIHYDSFEDLLEALLRDTADRSLSHQIRYFARATMIKKAA